MFAVRKASGFIQKSYYSTLACSARTRNIPDNIFTANAGAYSCRKSTILQEKCKTIVSVQRCMYCSSATNEDVTNNKENNEDMDSIREIYRYKRIIYARGLSRLKSYQTAFGVAVIPYLAYSHSAGEISTAVAANALFVLTLGTTMLYMTSYLIQKIVCILKFDDATQTVHISHLTFWGNRRDVSLPLSSFEPTSDSNKKQSQDVIRINTIDKKESFIIVLDSCTEAVKKEVREMFK